MKTPILYVLSLLTSAGAFTFGDLIPSVNFFKPTMPSGNIPPPPSIVDQTPSVLPMSINPLNPSASLEGRIFNRLDLVMTPIVTYFDENSPDFSSWNRSIELIMNEKTKKIIVADLYRKQPSDDREMKKFWGRIMGELLVKSISEIKGDLETLEKSLSIEKGKGAQTYEFKDFENRRLNEYAEFSGTTKLILDSLTLGILNRDQEMYTDIIRPFLDAAVAFKSLGQRMLANI